MNEPESQATRLAREPVEPEDQAGEVPVPVQPTLEVPVRNPESDPVQAVRQEIEKHQKELYQLATRVVKRIFGNQSHLQNDVEDIIQEAFIKAYENAGTFNGHNDIASVSSWFRRIARNLAIDHARKEKREVPLADESGIQKPTSGDFEAQFIRQYLEGPRRMAMLIEAIHLLPPKEQEVFLHGLENGFKNQGASAEHLGLPVSTYKGMLRRAKTELAKILRGMENQKRISRAVEEAKRRAAGV